MPDPQLDSLQGDELEGFDDVEEEVEEVDAELEALFALAQVDAEVAVAYEIVAQDVDARSVHDKLMEFAREHRRQASEIGAYLKAQGVEPAAPVPDPEGSAFATLANALSVMAPEAGLHALRASQHFTAAAYAALLEMVGDSPARALIERNLADEQRRARWLVDHPSAQAAAGDAEQ